jgi:hypothetical protein
MYLSVIASTFSQSVIASASAAALLNLFAITLHLARIGLAQRYDPPRRVPIDKDADEQSPSNMPEDNSTIFLELDEHSRWPTLIDHTSQSPMTT